MTKDEILAMEAGRKLDGLVATEIMGIEVEYPYGEGYPYFLVRGKNDRKVWDIVPLYSTGVSAAWQVVEKLGGAWDIQRRFRPHPDDTPDSPGVPLYKFIPYGVVDLLTELNVSSLITGRSPWVLSLPEAICKAALLAKLETISV